MAVALPAKIPFLPKLKEFFASCWQWINHQTQVSLKVFLPVFVGVMALLVAILMAIPAWHPPAAPETEAHNNGPSSRVVVSNDGKGAAPNAPVQNKEMTEREKQAVATNDANPNNPLLIAPIDALEEGPSRERIPKIADDGRRPWFVYSRPFDRADPRPRLAVVFADLGLNRLVSENAINNLPGPITLIFPSNQNADAWMGRARATGHEVLLSVPMEPFDYPASDPGPGTLLSNLPAEENIKRLRTGMSKGKGYVGVTTLSGSSFTSAPDELKPVLKEMLDRGLLWFDSRLVPLSSAYAVGEEMKMPSVRTDFRITSDKSQAQANVLLQDAEISARHSGGAVILVYASPFSLQMITDWIKTLGEKGFVLAPITAMVD